VAGKRKKTGRTKTRRAARKRVQKTPKRAKARGRRQTRKASAARSRARKRITRRRPVAPRKKASASRSSTPAPALAGEMYGEPDWRADAEGNRGLAAFNLEEDPGRRAAKQDEAEENGRAHKGEEDAEW